MIYVSCFLLEFIYGRAAEALYRLTHPPNGVARPAQCFLLAFSGCIFGSSGGVSASGGGGGGGFLPSPAAAASGFTVARYGNHKSWVFRHVSVRHTYIYIHRNVYCMYIIRVTRRKKKYSKFLLLSLLAFYLIFFFHSSDYIPTQLYGGS